MTISQIKYFLETAKCLNLTKAAQHLFITQPTLGRQITEIETELNMLLFIRSNKGLVLTPAGKVLYEELVQMIEEYEKSIKKASMVSQNITGKLTIGILDGLGVEEYIPDMVSFFEKEHPNIDIILKRKSFKPLLEEIHNGKLDAGISLDFHIEEYPEFKKIKMERYDPAFAVPLKNPISKKEKIDFNDFKDVPLAIVNKEECPSGVDLTVDIFLTETGTYPNLQFSESMNDVILWVESGMRCSLLNTKMELARSKSLKLIPFKHGKKETYIELAYSKDNINYALDLLLKYYASKA